MGHYRNNSIIVSSHFDDIYEAHAKATEIFARAFGDYIPASPTSLVSEILESVTNSIKSFFIAPDGSKEGWDTSDRGDAAREELIDWMWTRGHGYLDWAEIQFGDDARESKLVRDSDERVRAAT